MKEYDVVIVGAGPSGASAAISSSKYGLRTLIVEKRREVGVPVQCGEYMPCEDEVKRMFPKSKHIKNLVKLTKMFKVNKLNFVRFLTCSGNTFNVRYSAYVINREMFDKELIKIAKDNGCKVLLETSAVSVSLRKSKLALRMKNSSDFVSFKVLILAEGANQSIVKSIGLEATSNEDKAITIQNVMSELSIDEDVCEMYWDSNISPGCYAWIIPKGNGLANVGLGVRKKFEKDSNDLREYLNRFINNHNIASNKLKNGKVLSTVGGIVPVGGPIPKTYCKNAMVVGDAAGQVAAHVGGGVPSGIICGEIAGEVSYLHVKDRISLREYEKIWKKELGEILENCIILRRIGDLFIANDKLIDLALNAVGEKGLGRLIRGELPKELKFILSKAVDTGQAINKLQRVFDSL
jgi:geranylgeranyl reductase family protein